MVTAARERFNAQAALVLEAAIRATEKTQLMLSDPRTGTRMRYIPGRDAYSSALDPISVSNVMMQLTDVDDLTEGLAYSSRKVSPGTCVKDFLGMLSSADNPTPVGKAGAFISFGHSNVQVHFEVISRRLRRQVLESVVREKHGPEGLRILRLLMGTGKMDEKQVSDASCAKSASSHMCADCHSCAYGCKRCSTATSSYGGRLNHMHARGSQKR